MKGRSARSRPVLLFTGAGGAGNEALHRLLSARYETHFCDASPERIDPRIPPDRRHAIPLASHRTFAAALARMARKLRASLIVPGVDEELLKMDRVAALSGGIPILVPRSSFVALMQDKAASMRELRSLGLDTPVTHAANAPGRVPFPAVVKPRAGRGSRGFRIVGDRAELKAHLLLGGAPPQDVVIQELLQGQEYTVLAASDARGRLGAVVPVKVGLKRGITLEGETVGDRAIIAAARHLHTASKATGCYNIQLIKTRDGRIRPFEVNPRVSTTLCLAVAAGVDPFRIFLQGPPTGDLQGFTRGLRLRRHWTNHISPA